MQLVPHIMYCMLVNVMYSEAELYMCVCDVQLCTRFQSIFCQFYSHVNQRSVPVGVVRAKGELWLRVVEVWGMACVLL